MAADTLQKVRNMGYEYLIVSLAAAFGGDLDRGMEVLYPAMLAVTELIQSIDPDAFITVTKIKEVRGHGFTLERYTRIGELERLK